RFHVEAVHQGPTFLTARGLLLPEPTDASPEVEARFVVLRNQVREILDLLPQVPQELRETLEAITAPGALADLAAAYLDAKPEEKQEILEAVDLIARLDITTHLLGRRLEVLRLSEEIGRQTRSSLDERQREMLLREQMASIQKELGEDEGVGAQFFELAAAIE